MLRCGAQGQVFRGANPQGVEPRIDAFGVGLEQRHLFGRGLFQRPPGADSRPMDSLLAVMVQRSGPDEFAEFPAADPAA